MKAKNIIIASVASVTAVAMAAIVAVVYVNKAINNIKLDGVTD